MGSVFKRLFELLRRPTRYVGRDLEGNRFYEYPSTSEDPRRTKRMIEYHPASRKWDYVSGQARLPVQWSMWLTHTRFDPPTIEELQADLVRQQRIQESARLLEEQYKAEREAQKLLPEASTMMHGLERSSENRHGISLDEDKPTGKVMDDAAIERKKRLMMPPSSPPPETQAWTPRSARRG